MHDLLYIQWMPQFPIGFQIIISMFLKSTTCANFKQLWEDRKSDWRVKLCMHKRTLFYVFNFICMSLVRKSWMCYICKQCMQLIKKHWRGKLRDWGKCITSKTSRRWKMLHHHLNLNLMPSLQSRKSILSIMFNLRLHLKWPFTQEKMKIWSYHFLIGGKDHQTDIF